MYDVTKDKPLKSMTKKEAQKESKRRAGEMNEVIETIGQDSTLKALNPLREKMNLEEKVKKDKHNDELNLIDDKTKWAKKDPLKDPYRKTLCELIIKKVSETKWPKNYHFKALPTDEGVALLLMTPQKKVYGHGFKPTHLPIYDLNAVDILVMQAENRVDKLETPQTKGGIILPNGRTSEQV